MIYKKGIDKNKQNPLLIDAYGGYGIINSPYFSKTYMLWALEGGIMAIAHVRGGGEKGEGKSSFAVFGFAAGGADCKCAFS